MFSEGKLEELLRNVYYGGIDGAGYAEESVKGMLNMIDFHALAQAIRHEAQPVYAFALQGYLDGTFQRHGDRELFGQRATLLYEVPLDDEDWMYTGRLPHIRELWMLESGQLVTVSCARLELTVLSGVYVLQAPGRGLRRRRMGTAGTAGRREISLAGRCAAGTGRPDDESAADVSARLRGQDSPRRSAGSAKIIGGTGGEEYAFRTDGKKFPALSLSRGRP